ncbi:DUF1513 domain-containing protein [Maritalea sp.]|uniref:DUF1513 domain-containing protein n=1 Tax=Maritalea sp. TaxID=2003361 RepID=UPI003EF1BE5B
MWSRRDFIRIAGGAYIASLAQPVQAALSHSDQLFAATCKFNNGAFGLAFISETGEIISRQELPGRGHDVVQCPNSGNLLVFARRPGLFAALFDKAGKPIGQVTAPAGRHFYGHGIFSKDGKIFYATENDFDGANGIIGIYRISTQQIERIGEFASNGIGPHDIQLSADDQFLIVANGGIETHPDFARTKLNLTTMRPNISWISAKDGAVMASFEAPASWHKLSLRHMASHDGREVWVGGQQQGNVLVDVPLIARVSLDEGLNFIELPPSHQQNLAGYVGSIKLNADGKHICVTSPKGKRLTIFDRHGNVIQSTHYNDVCALAPNGKNTFQFGTGFGAFGATEGKVFEIDNIQFDNHMIAVR